MKLPSKTNIIPFIFSFVKSKLFFNITLFIYFINSAWIALSARYPMAFDEQFHYGIIKLYSEKLLPFWSASPSGDAPYGAVARDPSYIYHYLFSFIFRIIEPIFQSEMSQILVFRFINILIFGIGIWYFRKILINANFSKTISNLVLLLFVLTPIVPLLAAQLNYDNLLFMIFGLLIYKTQIFVAKISKDNKFVPKDFIIIALICIFGSLIKYAFLPAALAIVIYLLFNINKHIGFKNSFVKTYLSPFYKYQLKIKLVLIISFLVMFGLFSERYIVNVIKYKNPTPECNQVLSKEQCLAYGPWRRNFYTRQAKLENRLEKVYSNSFPRYLVTLWASQSSYQLFFTIDGATNDFKIGEAYRINRNGSIIIFVLGSIIFIIKNKSIRKKYKIAIFGIVSLFYLTALISQIYIDFLNLGYPFAIQGRYLIPILPLFYALIIASFDLTIYKAKYLKLVIVSSILLILMTQGGGAGTFIQRSDDTWYWQTKYPNTMNHYAKNVLKPLSIEKD